ncbi:MAG: glutamate-1-semialdehyde 2,1-aminomutase [Actinobacteria bacterium]|nr:glutamate-1-semialdehyde 2,1-aminomutase [Actinomycetota bacterium]
MTLFEQAQTVIPGGVNSPVRAFSAVGGEPFFVKAAQGAFLISEEGRFLLDYVQSWGASLFGHAPPMVVDALTAAAADGTSFGAPTKREIELAERICALVPSVEMVRLVNSGTEATMTAVRLARGATGRNKIIKFAGCYHGHVDALLASAGSGLATLGIPSSAGIPPGAVADTIVVDYNDIGAVEAAFAAHGGEIAGIIVEPVAGNMGLVAPAEGFLQGLRDITERNDAVLIFDEVMTGFRLGVQGAQGLFGIQPDLSCFGKVIGGGLPLAAIGGSRALMEHLAPVGAVYQAGTLSGNPLATAAGLAVLDAVNDDIYNSLEERAVQLQTGLIDAFEENEIDAWVPRVSTMVGVAFTNDPITNYGGAKAADEAAYASWFHSLLDNDIYVAPSAYEVLFPSLAHGAIEVQRTVEASYEWADGYAQLMGRTD